MNLKWMLPRTRFGEYLVGLNNLDERGFEKWVFHPGMLFHSTDRWWGNGGRRDHPHEGLDLCLYRDRYGNDHTLDETIRIPLMFDGDVVHIVNDFIGQSLFLIHDAYDGQGHQLYSIYGHTEPYDGIAEGKAIHEGTVIATVKDTRKQKAKMMPHLHLSVAWISKSLPHDKLNWKTIRDPGIATLLNPLELIDCVYTVVNYI